MRANPWLFSILMALGATTVPFPAARAQTTAPAIPESAASASVMPPSETQPVGADFWSRSALFGDLLGSRPALGARGITFQLQETSEVLGNVRGGTRRGVVYEGMTQASLGFDFGKMGLWQGGSVLISALQLHGRGASSNLLGNPVHIVSGIEATRATRLYDAYFEQKFFDGRVSIRIGQMRADDEFLISQYGLNGGAGDPNAYAFASANALFVNATFGFPALLPNDLPSGGPAFPLAAPGIRLRVQPIPSITLLAAAFNGDPAGSGNGDPQLRNHGGILFPLRDGVLAFVEAQYAVNQAHDAPGLPGTYRIGGWFHNGTYPDQRYGTDGLPLADPASNGIARGHHGTYGFYAMFDQMVLQTGKSRDQGIGVFARVMGTPGDYNQISFYLNGGITWKGPIPGRENDSLGLGIAYAAFSGQSRRLDQDAAAFDPSGFHPVRNQETVLELTYQYQATGWLAIQPDIQWISHPGGGIPDPFNPGRRVRDSLLLGLRTAITF